MPLLKQPYNTLLSSTLSFRNATPRSTHKTTPVHVHEFLQLHPYDVWNLVFKHLDLGDFLQCTGVCQAWYNFMIHWPEFWQHFLRVPHMNRLAMDILIRRQAHEFCLHGPMDDAVTQFILLFLPYSNNYSMRKLSFKNLNFTRTDAGLLARALRLLILPVEEIEFVDCGIPRDMLICPVLESCSNLARISFHRSQVSPKGFDIGRPSWRSIITSGASFLSLTYLKICAEDSGFNRNWATSPINSARLSALLRKCPNLVHLFLDSGGSAYQGVCIRQAVNHCPKLKTLVVSDKAEMPTTVLGTADTLDSEQTATSTTKGISIFVLSGGRIQMEVDDVISVYKAAHKSLELLYLHYGGGNGTIDADVFAKFARWTAPRLREVRISTEAGGAYACYNQKQPITTAVAAFLSKCPALEAIRIEDTFSTGYNPHEGRLDVDDYILKVIAENCPQLRHLAIVGRRCHTNSGILHFAKTGGKNLIYLEIDTYRKNLWTLVKDLGSMKTLHLRKDSLFHNDKIDPADVPPIKYMLRKRGGSITLPIIECPEPMKDIFDIEEGVNNNKDASTL
ncbi:hypothetical protein BJV82DRAFT_673430 [Fennellomyces sp. T-0311]|nr:hypothetical protein BJV82DRAFT_673430 [Fennellomyces sp. T-0311]